MAASGTRERRPAVWPWLVMPLIVLVVFYALYRVHQPQAAAVTSTQDAPAAADAQTNTH
jgi:hypothetical protein